MFRTLLLILGTNALLTLHPAIGQTILNGDFEINTAGSTQINLLNSDYNSYMANSTGFGDWNGGGPGGGNLDIIDVGNMCGFAQSGDWFVALTGGGTDAFSLELSAPLVAGNSYTLTFYDRTCSDFPQGQPIEIGVSNSNDLFGTSVYTAPVPVQNVGWTQRTATFVAPTNAMYLTVRCNGANNGGDWTQVDHFELQHCNIHLGNDTTLCSGATLLLDATTPGATYLWQDGSTNSTFLASGAGTYWVTVNDNGCIASDTIVLDYATLPTVDLGHDTTLCQGQYLLLNASAPNATYLWQDGTTSSTFQVHTGGQYHVTVAHRCGTVSDTLYVQDEVCECYVYLPNAFTPNNDGYNDHFTPLFDCLFNHYQLMVFDRWGNLLFTSDVPDHGWDGTYQNKAVPPGVYAYVVHYSNRFNEAIVTQHGHVTVVR